MSASLIVPVIAAAVGAYFAVVKTRRERLWAERYETLRDITLNLQTLQSSFEAKEMEHHGVPVITTKEDERFEAEFPNTRYELRRSLAKLRLIIDADEIEGIKEIHKNLNVAFYDLYNNTSGADYPDQFKLIANIAEKGIEAAVRLAQKYCL